MKTTLVAVTFAALLATAGLGSAAPQDAYTVSLLGYYFICGPPIEVWEETNGVGGLQKSPWKDERGEVHAADTAVLILDAIPLSVRALQWWYC